MPHGRHVSGYVTCRAGASVPSKGVQFSRLMCMGSRLVQANTARVMALHSLPVNPAKTAKDKGANAPTLEGTERTNQMNTR